jgi:hypothetical protein
MSELGGKRTLPLVGKETGQKPRANAGNQAWQEDHEQEALLARTLGSAVSNGIQEEKRHKY